MATLTLIKRGDRDRHVQMALVHAVLAVAADGLDLDEWQSREEPPDQDQ